MPMTAPFAVRIHLLYLVGWSSGCSSWLMPNDPNNYCISGRTTDLGNTNGLAWAIMTSPIGRRLHPEAGGVRFAKFGALGVVANASIGFEPHHGPTVNGSQFIEDRVYAGINTEGLTCDCQTLTSSELAPPTNTSKDLNVLYFCQWALSMFANTDEVRAALLSGSVHIWGAKDGIHTHHALRDAHGRGLVVEYVGQKMQVYQDLDDGGKTGYGVMTNGPEFPYMVRMVQNFEWKRTLARTSSSMPGDWYADSRFLRLHLVKEGMRAAAPASHREALLQTLHVMNVVTVPMGEQLGTDSGHVAFETGGVHTTWGVIYDHKERTLYWRTEENHNLQRVELSDLNLTKSAPVEFVRFDDASNGLPWYNDASKSFAKY